MELRHFRYFVAAAEKLRARLKRCARALFPFAALGGLDVLVFTGGIGQYSAAVREQVCRDAAWLGIELDSRANTAGGPCITRAGSRVSAWVIPTDEDLTIARHTVKLIGAANNVLSLAIAVRSVRCCRRIFLPVKAVDPRANGRPPHREGPDWHSQDPVPAGARQRGRGGQDAGCRVPEVAAQVAAAEAELGRSGRILVRPSGTKQAVRVMVEALDADHARHLADQLASVIRATS